MEQAEHLLNILLFDASWSLTCSSPYTLTHLRQNTSFSLLLTTQGDTREKDLREGYDVFMSEEWKVISDKLLVETVVMRILTFQSPSKLVQGDEIIDNLKVL